MIMIRACLITALILTTDIFPEAFLRNISPHYAYSLKNKTKQKWETNIALPPATPTAPRATKCT